MTASLKNPEARSAADKSGERIRCLWYSYRWRNYISITHNLKTSQRKPAGTLCRPDRVKKVNSFTQKNSTGAIVSSLPYCFSICFGFVSCSFYFWFLLERFLWKEFCDKDSKFLFPPCYGYILTFFCDKFVKQFWRNTKQNITKILRRYFYSPVFSFFWNGTSFRKSASKTPVFHPSPQI